MKKLNLSVLALAGALALSSCTAQPGADKTATTSQSSSTSKTMADHGLQLSEMDKTVRPQDDFYNYVNGTWMKNAVIPSDKPSWGSFNELREKTDDNSLKILNGILSKDYAQGTEGQKIKDLYATYMDMNKRNADGIKPIKSELAAIDAIKSISDLQNYLKEATKKGDNPFYGWYVMADLKDSKMNAVYLGDADLGLGRDYYQKQNARNTEVLGEYKKYVTSMLDILGYKNSTAVAENIVNFETQMAKTLLTNEEVRNTNLMYNPKKISELKPLVKNVDLPNYLSAVGVNTNQVILPEINYYKNLDNFINQKNLPLIKDYMKYHLLADNAGRLSKELDDLSFNFYSKYLNGQKEQRAMNKRALSTINGVLGEAFGKLYVEEYFPAEAKQQMLTYIDYLKKSFAHHIDNLEWMSTDTKVKALEKLNKFTVKVAYPDKWKDYSKLSIKPASEGGTLYSNLENVSAWAYQRNLNKIGKPVDKTEWGMSPQTVNAYYNPMNNEIVFPAAILQPPFFNPKADPAVNFGGIGAVIGHEMTHGFDDSGALFDADGNLINWWTEADKKSFETVTKQLADQYSKYEPVKGSFVNGTFTNGENIADLGGVNIAYDALQMYLKDHGNPGTISGYTQDQRFFMSWATVWRTKSTDEYMQNQVKTDPHSPGYFRAFGPLVNTDAFYKAFDVKSSDKLYKPEDKRIKIW